MPKLEAVSVTNLFCLFKGEPGTRKSGAALSFPGPQYWFSYDRKMEGLLIPARKWGIDMSTVDYDDYSDWNAAKTKLEGFRTNCKYKTIIIDSITSAADAINRQTLKVKGGEGKGKGIAGIPVNSIEDYNAEDSALKEMIALLKDIQGYHKLNVILIAHVIQKEIKSADGSTHFARTIVTAGKGIAQKIPAYCSEVYHFNIVHKLGQEVGQYALFTQHTGDDFGRSSLELDRHIVFNDDPLYEKFLLPAITKSGNSSTPVNQETANSKPTETPKTSKFGVTS